VTRKSAHTVGVDGAANEIGWWLTHRRRPSLAPA